MGSRVEEIAAGVFKLQFELPYDVQPVNIYLLDGDPVTLVDAGPILEGVTEEVPAKLEEIGFPPSRIGRIVLTHHHPDHMGLAARLRNAGGAEIICHRSGELHVADYWNESDRVVEHLISLSTYVGLDPELTRITVSKTHSWKYVAEPVPVDRLVDDGDLIKGDPYSLEVVHTPGHCIDHICLYLTEHRLLFTGDMLLYSITPNPDMYPPWLSDERSGLPDYIKSLKKIRRLDVGRALPGHGKDVEDFRGRVDEVLRHHDDRMEYVAKTLADEEMTILRLGLELLDFIDAERTPENVFLAMREVYGHIVLLEEIGKINVEIREGVGYYSSL